MYTAVKKCSDTVMPIAHLRHYNDDTIVHIGPCLLTGITVSSDTGAGSVDVYDGQNAHGELKAHIEVIANTTFGVKLMYPADFDRGIFIDVNDKTTHVMIQFIPEDWHKFV